MCRYSPHNLLVDGGDTRTGNARFWLWWWLFSFSHYLPLVAGVFFSFHFLFFSFLIGRDGGVSFHPGRTSQRTNADAAARERDRERERERNIVTFNFRKFVLMKIRVGASNE